MSGSIHSPSCCFVETSATQFGAEVASVAEPFEAVPTVGMTKEDIHEINSVLLTRQPARRLWQAIGHGACRRDWPIAASLRVANHRSPGAFHSLKSLAPYSRDSHATSTARRWSWSVITREVPKP